MLLSVTFSSDCLEQRVCFGRHICWRLNWNLAVEIEKGTFFYQHTWKRSPPWRMDRITLVKVLCTNQDHRPGSDHSSQVPQSTYPLTEPPQREAGDVWCLPPVWNLRAVIWFHFAISSLALLPSPVTLSVLSFSACWSFLLNFFQKILQYFSLRDRLFCMAPV